MTSLTTRWTVLLSGGLMLSCDGVGALNMGDIQIGGHPCTGYVTDALWMDTSESGYLGCGTDAAGVGFWATEDGGQTWSPVRDSETGETFFSTFRVNDVWRSPDTGLLYVSGNSTVGSHRVVSMDPSGKLAEVRNNGSLYDYSFSAASYVRTSSGVEVTEALTGGQVLVRKDDPAWQEAHSEHNGWANGYGWWESDPEGDTYGGIMDLDVHGDFIVGCGSAINEPPVVYLPPRDWTFGTDADQDEDGTVEQLWDVVPLVDDSFSSYYGEMWDIDADAGGIVVGGVNQAAGEGMVYSIGPEWTTSGYVASAWTVFKVSDLLGTTDSTWVRGVCRSGDRVIAVGEYSNTSTGFVILSDDGGKSFSDLSGDIVDSGLTNIPPLQRCQILSDGSWIVAGGAGAFIRAN
jgi:hypothetical protein